MAHPSAAAQAFREELRSLLKQHAYQRLDKPVRLASGHLSEEYFDGKQITLFPERVVLFARLLFELLDFRRFEAVGGMSLGADPIISALSVTAFLDRGIRIPGFLVRKQPKLHGLQRVIEGVVIGKGMRVLVVDDVITRGTSTLKAIEAVEESGARIEQVACMVDREEGGGEVIAAKYPFLSVFKKSEL